MELREQLFLKASEFYGLIEIPGVENNTIIMGWAEDLGIREGMSVKKALELMDLDGE